MAELKEKNIGLTFVNYNYAFNKFYENYKNQCLLIADKTLISQLEDIRKIISTFIYEYEYTIKDKKQRKYYRTRLRNIKEKFINDEDIKILSSKDFSLLKNRITHHNKYYEYFLLYLKLMGDFSMELTTTFMPHTNIQQKLIRFSNNQPFFEKFSQHKEQVIENLSTFNMKKFNKCFNNLIAFYYAYSLFVNNEDKLVIEEAFTLIISFYLNKDNLDLLNKGQGLTELQFQEYKKNSNILHESLLFVNSKMNDSFSNYDVLPKLQSKIYLDKTLI